MVLVQRANKIGGYSMWLGFEKQTITKTSSFDFMMEVINKFPYMKDNYLFMRNGCEKSIMTIEDKGKEYFNEIWRLGDHIIYSNHDIPFHVDWRRYILEDGQIFYQDKTGQLPDHQLPFPNEPQFIKGTFESIFHPCVKFKVICRTSSMCRDGVLYSQHGDTITETHNWEGKDFDATYWIVDEYGQKCHKRLHELTIL